MQKFLEDRKDLTFLKNYVTYSEEERPHLNIGHPAILATFMGYVKFQTHAKTDKDVFFRGQTNNHTQIIPSLLRGDNFDTINNLSKAYEELKRKTKITYTQTRFRDETIDNLFQHYGIKSKTLDLVDNIYIAIWFATNQWKKINGFTNLCTYTQSDEEFGWIYFMHVAGPERSEKDVFSNLNFTGYCDLRKYHSSLSARLHCQHGITYFRDNKGTWDEKNRCFDDLVIATVKFPNSEEFKMNGTIFTKEFLFPNSQIDDTYNLFSQDGFSHLLSSVEEQYRLEKGALGQIWTYNF